LYSLEQEEMMLKKSIQLLNRVRGQRLQIEEILENPPISATQDSGVERVAIPATTDQDSFDKMMAELRLALATPETERV
jgi:hypothetical protein